MRGINVNMRVRFLLLLTVVGVAALGSGQVEAKKRRVDPAGVEPRGVCGPGDNCLKKMFTSTFPGYKRTTRRTPPKEQGVFLLGGTRRSPATDAEKAALQKLLLQQSTTVFKRRGLLFVLRTITFSSADGARRAVAHYLVTADNNTGHNYTWNYVLHVEKKVYLLDAPCRFSYGNFKRIANKLRRGVAPPKGVLEVTCSCGGGCGRTKPR